MTTCLLLAALVVPWPTSANVGAEGQNPFPAPESLEPAIHFWTRIYSEVATDGGLVHDSRDLGIVYEVVRLPEGASHRSRERFTEQRKQHYKEILRRLARGKRSNLSAEEARVLALFPPDVTDRSLSDAAGRLRFQLGQANKFRAGVIRSGAYIDHIRETLEDEGLPPQIANLPHVESSYTPHASSRVGAAGLWQFTRSTGRRFMRVDHVVDERLDPYRATVAAARLLKQNRRVTGSWPLAITAYNHGAAGMRRAVRKLGTRDIAQIVERYRSRSFGFASRNFYVEFLAATRVAENHEQHFGPLVLDPPIDYAEIELPFYTTPEALQTAFGVSEEELKKANPALLPSVWQGQKRIPKGFKLAVRREHLATPLSAAISAIPTSAHYTHQTRDSFHVIRRGETLSRIASRYGVRTSELEALNGLHSRHRIRAGQKLRLPTDHMPVQTAAVSRPLPIEATTPPPDGLYTVQRGDTLSRIATRFGMGEGELLVANRLRNRNRIYVGQVLRVSTAIDQALVRGASEDVETREPDSHPQGLVLMTPSHGAMPDPEPQEPEDLEAVEAQDAVDVELVDEDGPPADAGDLFEEPAVVPVSAADAASDPDLLADPSDYSVAPDGTIEVQATETLGHFADWLGIRASRLRAINDLRYGEPVAVHSHLRLDFSQVTPQEFEATRTAYHRAMQEEFFARWEINGTTSHRMRKGDSLWVLSHRKFNVPLWLLRQYNPDVDFEALTAGTRITVPQLRRRVFDDEDQTATAPESRSSQASPAQATEDQT